MFSSFCPECPSFSSSLVKLYTTLTFQLRCCLLGKPSFILHPPNQVMCLSSLPVIWSVSCLGPDCELEASSNHSLPLSLVQSHMCFPEWTNLGVLNTKTSPSYRTPSSCPHYKYRFRQVLFHFQDSAWIPPPTRSSPTPPHHLLTKETKAGFTWCFPILAPNKSYLKQSISFSVPHIKPTEGRTFWFTVAFPEPRIAGAQKMLNE